MHRSPPSPKVALAFLLVVVGGLLLRSFVSMIDDNPGFRPGGVITASLELPTARYERAMATEFYLRAAERVGALPGVEAVAFSSDLPWSGYDENTSFAVVGRQFPDREGPEARYHFLTWFLTMLVVMVWFHDVGIAWLKQRFPAASQRVAMHPLLQWLASGLARLQKASS